ncbi:MAG TPA: transcriptional repressor [Polyangia bacterium]|jgi:Fur family ferric uptake transcriptional regulator|nr:transcriptional repressor [Polyangia bacterium]HWE29406.1 transcriptional repressor [Polyangia bacterium]
MSPKQRAPRKNDVQQLVERLRGAGLRRTGSRVAVLDRLAQATAPLSHAEIADALEPLNFDRATVYRNLIDLTDAKLVSRSDLGDHVWRFSLIDEDAPLHGMEHPHLVCNDCGTVVCMPDVKVKLAAKRPLPQFAVQLRGLCQECGD